MYVFKLPSNQKFIQCYHLVVTEYIIKITVLFIFIICNYCSLREPGGMIKDVSRDQMEIPGTLR